MNSDWELINSLEENLKWFQNNFNKIRESYEKKIVAIKNKKIIASADNSKQLLDLLEEKGIDNSEVLIEAITPKNEIVIL